METHQLALDQEQQTSEILRLEIEERVAELDALRKKANREVTVNSGQETSKHHSTPSKNEVLARREEVTGLKCVDLVACVSFSELQAGILSKSFKRRTRLPLSRTNLWSRRISYL